MTRLSTLSATRLLTLALCAVLLAGCGKRYGTIPVRGKVTFNGGPLPEAGMVFFTPTETFGGYPRRPASANFGPDGEYVVSSFAGSEGLFPGIYEVTLQCWKVRPTTDGPKAVSYLPAKYERGDMSGVKLTVEENSSSKEFNIDITETK